MAGEVLSFLDLKVGYRDSRNTHEVLSRLCGSLPQGRLTSLLGGNGVGKSTLLRTLSAFQAPLGGSIRLMDKPLEDISSSDLSRLLSVVLTYRPTLDRMSVYDVASLGRSPYTGFFGRLSARDHEVVDRSLRMVHMEDLKDRMVDALSDGERQKVMIAKSLAQDTPLILLDEPTAFLDYPGKVEMMRLLLELTRGAGKTILLSTHDVELALQMSDAIWLLDSASDPALLSGSPEDLALDGTLGGYFINAGILYDPHKGSLGPGRVGGLRPVEIIGDEACALLLEKGLVRHGMRLREPDEEPVMRIFVKAESTGRHSFQADVSGETVTSSSFDGLLWQIEDLAEKL